MEVREDYRAVAEPVSDSDAVVHVINITTLDVGYTVVVGCKSFAFSSAREMLNAIEAYLKNPKDVEREFNETGKIPK